MFLETLLSTRERLVLSYVARDELTGRVAAAVVGAAGAARHAGRGLPAARRADEAVRAERAGRRCAATTIAARLRAVAAGRAARRRPSRWAQSLRAALPAGRGDARPAGPAPRAAARDRSRALAAPARRPTPPPARRAPRRRGATGWWSRCRPSASSWRIRCRARRASGCACARSRATRSCSTARRRPSRPIACCARPRCARPCCDALLARRRSRRWRRDRAPPVAAARRGEELRGRAPTGFFADGRAAGAAAHPAGLAGASWRAGPAAGRSAGRFIRFGRPPARASACRRCAASRSGSPICPAPTGPRRASPGGGDRRAHRAAGRRRRRPAASVLFTCRSAARQRPPAAGSAARASSITWPWRRPGARRAPHGVARGLGRTASDHAATAARFRAARRRGGARLPGGAGRRIMLTGARDAPAGPPGVHPYLLPCEAVFAARSKRQPRWSTRSRSCATTTWRSRS